MSRQSQDLYTSVRTAHNKIDKLDTRLTACEAHDIRLLNLIMEFRQHETQQAYEDSKLDKRLTATEHGHGERLEVVEWIQCEHVKEIAAFDKRLTVFEGDGEDNAEVIQGHQLRLTALDEIAHEHIGYSDPPVKPAPQLQFGLHFCCVGWQR